MQKAVDRARKAEGPSALECTTTRFFGHFEGDPQNYRAKGEVEQHRAERDCLKIFRARVDDEAWITGDELDAIDNDVLALIDKAVNEAQSAPPPAISELMTDVYVSY